MSTKLRTKRLQRYLNDVHKAQIAIDGAYGGETNDALEKIFCLEDWARTKVVVSEFNKRTEKNLATLDPNALATMRQLVALAKKIGKDHGVTVKVLSGNRSWEEQDKLYAKGRTAPGKVVTNARGGQSNHNFGIAIDFGIFKGSSYLDGSKTKSKKDLAHRVHKAIGEAAKTSGLDTKWGGDWRKPDYPHHEIKTGLSLSQKQTAFMENSTVLNTG